MQKRVENKPHLKKKKRVSAWLAFQLIFPVTIGTIVLNSTHDALFTFLTFNLGLVLLPQLSYFFVRKQLREAFFIFIIGTRNPGKQVIIGGAFAIFMMGFVQVLLQIVLAFIPSVFSDFRIPGTYNFLYLAFIGFTFGIINPFVEEIFWRVYVRAIFMHVFHDNALKVPYDSITIPEMIFNSIFFASYHFFVMEYFLGWKLSILGTVVITIVGVILFVIKVKIGIWAAIIAHMSFDMSLVWAFSEFVFNAMLNIDSTCSALIHPDYAP